MKKLLMLVPLSIGLVAGTALAQDSGEALIQKYKCTACHKVDKKVIGPSYQDVAAKFAGNAAAPAELSDRIKKGSKGVWGPVAMPPNPTVPDADMKKIVDYILAQKK